MGNPTSPDDSTWEGCPDCCDELPTTLFARVYSPIWGTFSGYINQSVLDTCSFGGELTGDAGTIIFGAAFCTHNDNMSLGLGGDAWLDAVCSFCTKLYNNCKIPQMCYTNLGCEFMIA